jgi:hypothetical protein
MMFPYEETKEFAVGSRGSIAITQPAVQALCPPNLDRKLNHALLEMISDDLFYLYISAR